MQFDFISLLTSPANKEMQGSWGRIFIATERHTLNWGLDLCQEGLSNVGQSTHIRSILKSLSPLRRAVRITTIITRAGML